MMAKFARECNGDPRFAVLPGVLHSNAVWGNGTTEYALDALLAAPHQESTLGLPTSDAYICPVDPDVRMPMVYVDDLRMAGPKDNLVQGWKLIQQGRDLDDPTPVGKCLGCSHEESTCKLENGRVVRVMEYDMTEFMGSCVDAYRTACGQTDLELRKVDTPFIPAAEGAG